MTRRWDVVGWKDCAHLALHHPWSLVISGRKARRTMRRERGSSRLTLWEGGELDARGGATGVWLPPTHVGVLARGGKLWICIQVRNPQNIVQPCSWGKSPWFPRSWSPCTSPCWQEQMKPFKFHFVGRSAPQFHTSLSIELILEHKSLQKSPNTLALNFDSLDFWA